ncbi:YVTN repeat-like/Quino protein amine dehydrogenase [Setomelanomma holmii]|uniref:YVTN repeat-like/Quino protein amine dehydrogenase n=1 Tax=Setomelanomma holmii TaxID=210430 RepID=A0A9P4LK33_9PLEO|nr:YVTN repeat-like/Quino protein amine dehydrogenase [Setomelanomma holmii]
MSPRCYSRKDFLDEYSFPRTTTLDFERDGHPAEFASGHPREWDNYSVAFDFGKETTGNGDRAYVSFHSALSSDQKLLAISSNRDRILVYDVASKELRTNLEGAGKLAFKPAQGPERPGYTLLSSISYDGDRGALPQNQLILWDLDQHGRLLDEEEPIDTTAFAEKAIDAILPELISNHEWTKEFAQASNLYADFEKALSLAAASHRRRHHTILDHARLGSFGSETFSMDGRLLLYHAENGSTQRGMRDPDKLPQVIVYDIDAGREVHRLQGHTDAIMWSGLSPDCEHVASVSWDGTLRMYSASTGHLEWTTEDSGGQSWAGAFTPDSKHIIWSSKGGRVIKVHDVATGDAVSSFQEELNDWCRCFEWHPAGDRVAFCVGKHAYVWDPYDGPSGTVLQHFQLDDGKDWRGMASTQSIGWMEDGRKISVQFSDGTKLVYDTETNSKEVFARPKGVDAAWVDSGFYGTLREGGDGQDFYLSVDGDGKVRYWRTSVPAYPSWWEKENDEKETEKSTKKKFPETGKYVKITKVASKGGSQKQGGRSSWAEKGAELWTAE